MRATNRRAILFVLFAGLMVAQLWLEVSAAEGMHYLKRSFRKKQMECRKECEAAGVARRGGATGQDEADDSDDDDASWDGLNVIEGLGSEVGKRPLSLCVAKCISPHCFDLEYNRALEPGEVDERYDFFRKCYSLEAAEASKRERARRYGSDEDDE